MSNNKSSSSGLGIFSVVGIVFIVLKCVGVIDWSWWWVLSPFWIGILFSLIVIAIVFLVFLVSELGKRQSIQKFKKTNIAKCIKEAQENAERKKKENQDKENQEKE